MLRIAATATTALAWALLSAPIPPGSSPHVPSQPHPAAYGITTIVGIENRSSGSIDVVSQENPGSGVRVQIGQTVPARINIPWCTSQGDFEGGHYIRMDGPPGGFYYLWQSNENWQDRVRFADKPWWKPGATPVPGVSEVNGERILVINADRTITLRRP